MQLQLHALPLAFVSLIFWYRQHLEGKGGFVMLKPFGARATPVRQMLSNPSLIMHARFLGVNSLTALFKLESF